MRLILCGCGALGSRIAMELCHLRHDWVLVDDDVVGKENLGTSAFWEEHITMLKAQALAEMMWRKGKTVARAYPKTLAPAGIKMLLREVSDVVVVDCFDNPRARLLVSDLLVPTLHVGVGQGYTGSVVWDYHWTSPDVDYERGHNPVCTNQLGDDVIRFTSNIAVVSLKSYLIGGFRDSFYINNPKYAVKIA